MPTSCHPLAPDETWAYIAEWLACEPTWVPGPGERHGETLGELVTRHQIRGNLVPDAQLTALALEHGLTICSADSDFARFPEKTHCIEASLAPKAPCGMID